MAYKSILYRIYPNKDQEKRFQDTFAGCRFVYNKMLEVQNKRHENGEEFLHKLDANKYCTNVLKKGYPFLREIDSFALTNTVFNLDYAFGKFFKRECNRPIFKKKRTYRKSYKTNFTSNNLLVCDKSIRIPKIGYVNAVVHRKPKENWITKSAVVTQNRDGTYQVSILFYCDEKPTPVLFPTEDNTLGLDYKLSGLYIDSNGRNCNMPHYFLESKERVAHAQRKLKHKVIGSNNYYKQQKRISKIHRHIANQRKDFLHKESTAIAKQYDFVCVETLDMERCASRMRGFGKYIYDNGYGMFTTMLENKLKERGGQLIKIDRYYPSSQICHHCGHRNPIMRKTYVRTFDCPVCGHKGMDRDYNAAINIKFRGLEFLIAKTA